MKKRCIAMAVAAIFAMGTAVAQQPVPQKERPATQQRHDQANEAEHHAHHGPHRHGDPHGQHHPQTPPPPQYNADGIDMAIVRAFPEVKSVKKTAKWTEVYDAHQKRLGYVVYSKPASDGIKGYNGETPVLIALNARKRILGVYPLPNVETPRFAQRVQEAGYYANWNGLTIKQALRKKVDTVSGATFTSRAVAQSVQAALRQL